MTSANQTKPQGITAEVAQPVHSDGRPPEVLYGVRIPNAGPFTLERCREIMALLALQDVPDDAQVQWSYPDVWASWRRYDPLGKTVIP